MKLKDKKVGIVAAHWNPSVTDKLFKGALDAFKKNEINEKQIEIVRCPGAFEIPSAAQMLLPKVAGIVTIGAVIRGETPHFEYISEAVSHGIMQLNNKYNKLLTFGVLTTNTSEQAAERYDRDSSFGNKGAEAALSLIKMIELKAQLS